MSRGPTREVGELEGADYARAFRAANKLADEGRSWSGNERNRCFLNIGQARFANASATSGVDFPDDGRALAVTDWDSDGDLDLFLVNRTAPQVRFLRNDWQTDNQWLALRLVGTECNRDAIGARVELYRDGLPGKDIRSVYAGCSFLSQSSKWVHFGLGNKTNIQRVVVRWPGGSAETFGGLGPGTRYRLVQGSGRAEPVTLDRELVRLLPSKPTVPAASEQARVVLRAPAPLPALTATKFDGQPLPLDWGEPTLLQLWVSWCPKCQAELTEFTRRAEDVRSSGVRVVALSVDGLGQDASAPEQASQLVKRLRFPFVAGRATEQMLEKLELLRGELYSNSRPFPVPTSFLIDAEGQLVCVYVGPIDVDQLTRDVQLVSASLGRRRDLESTLQGRWFTSPRSLILTGLASAFRDAGYEEDADTYQQRAIPQLALGYCGAALDSERQGDIQQANALYQRALKLDPENPRAHNYYGEYLMRRKAVDDALGSFRKAIELDPSLAAAHHNLATTHVLQRKFNDAIASYLQAIELDPQLARSHAALGRLLQSAGRHDEAATYFEAALAINPNLTAAHVYLGSTRVHQQRYSDAAEHFAAAIQLSPNQPDAHEALGRLRATQGKYKSAIHHLREAVRLNPKSRIAALHLSWNLSTNPEAEHRAGEEALRLAERVVAGGLRSPQVLDILAAAYAEVGQFEQAVKATNAALEQLGTDSDSALAREIQRRQSLYEKRMPFRRSSHLGTSRRSK